MRNNRVWYLMFALALLSVLVLSACAAPAPTAAPEAPAEEEAAPAAPAEEEAAPAEGSGELEIFSWWTAGRGPECHVRGSVRAISGP